jgi:hypothetical protein
MSWSNVLGVAVALALVVLVLLIGRTPPPKS